MAHHWHFVGLFVIRHDIHETATSLCRLRHGCSASWEKAPQERARGCYGNGRASGCYGNGRGRASGGGAQASAAVARHGGRAGRAVPLALRGLQPRRAAALPAGRRGGRARPGRARRRRRLPQRRRRIAGARRAGQATETGARGSTPSPWSAPLGPGVLFGLSAFFVVVLLPPCGELALPRLALRCILFITVNWIAAE